jgi:hypothetical protein
MVLEPHEPRVLTAAWGSGLRLSAIVDSKVTFAGLLLVCVEHTTGRELFGEVVVTDFKIGDAPMIGKPLPAVAFRTTLGLPEGAPLLVMNPGTVIELTVTRMGMSGNPIACSAVVHVRGIS